MSGEAKQVATIARMENDTLVVGDSDDVQVVQHLERALELLDREGSDPYKIQLDHVELTLEAVQELRKWVADGRKTVDIRTRKVTFEDASDHGSSAEALFHDLFDKDLNDQEHSHVNEDTWSGWLTATLKGLFKRKKPGPISPMRGAKPPKRLKPSLRPESPTLRF